MSNLSCKSEIPEVKGLEANQMTVGRHLILNCEGDWNKAFDFSKASVKLEANLKNTMKVFKVEARNAEKFDVDMTLYSVGSFEIPDLVLSDGTNEISLGRQQFQLSSVIEKSEDQKPPNPFGPILPLTLSWPAIYAVLFVAVIFSSGLFVIFNLKRRVRFKRLIDTLKTFDSSLDPDVQFYKTIDRKSVV